MTPDQPQSPAQPDAKRTPEGHIHERVAVCPATFNQYWKPGLDIMLDLPGGKFVATTSRMPNDNADDCREQAVMAQRIVACWNACLKLKDPAAALSRAAEALEEALVIVDEAYVETGHAKVAKTSKQRLRIEASIAELKGEPSDA